LTTSFGAGHVRAAEALRDAFHEQHPDGEIYIYDFLRNYNRYLSRAAEEAYYAITKHTPRMYKFFYQLESTPVARLGKMESRLGRGKLLRLIDELRPDAIISTHFLPAGVLDRLAEKVTIPTGVVMTDYESHPIWLYPRVNAYFIAHEGMRGDLVASGVEPSRIHVTGIPIKAQFGQDLDREGLRKRFLAHPEWPVVLVVSGGQGVGPLMEVMESLDGVTLPLQAVVIAGRNRVLAKRLREYARSLRVPVQVLGFVDNIHEWMAAADLIVSKAGGLTVSEAIAARLPMMIVRPTPGQEDGNTDYVTWLGAGVHVRDVELLTASLNQVFRDPQRLEDMRRAAQRIARPHAATDIIRTMTELVDGR
jgi:processive 1,2-diacylglycerol beta-glucosyltransferase